MHNKIIKIIQAAVILATGVHLQAQGTFQNLDFESSSVGSVSFGTFPVSEALPNWTVTINGIEQTTVSVNYVRDWSSVSLISSAFNDGGFRPIDGNYDVELSATSPYGNTSISQSGIIPAGTQSLLFDATKSPTASIGNFTVSLGNQIVPITPVATATAPWVGPYTIYQANISAWAGQTAQLTFTALAPPPSVGWNAWFFDDISFAPNAVVPEPKSFALMGIGGLLFAGYRRFGPKRA